MERYGIVMKELLAAYRRGVGGVAVHDNGWCGPRRR